VHVYTQHTHTSTREKREENKGNIMKRHSVPPSRYYIAHRVSWLRWKSVYLTPDSMFLLLNDAVSAGRLRKSCFEKDFRYWYSLSLQQISRNPYYTDTQKRDNFVIILNYWQRHFNSDYSGAYSKVYFSHKHCIKVQFYYYYCKTWQ
jgi:hypothetical protein